MDDEFATAGRQLLTPCIGALPDCSTDTSAFSTWKTSPKSCSLFVLTSELSNLHQVAQTDMIRLRLDNDGRVGTHTLLPTA